MSFIIHHWKFAINPNFSSPQSPKRIDFGQNNCAYFMPPKSKIFLYGCLSFLIGVGAASFAPIRFIEKNLLWFGIFIGSAAIAALIGLILENSGQKIVRLFLLFLFFSLFALGVWRFAIDLPGDSPDKIWHYNGKEAAVFGRITSRAYSASGKMKLEMETEKIKPDKNAVPLPVSGKILLTADIYPEYSFGDLATAQCKLERPENFNDFDYGKYLARYDIYSICNYPKIELQGKDVSGPGDRLYEKILKAREALIAIVNQGMSEPEGSLANAIVLGDQKSMPEDLKQDFSRAGISHITAISGMNITIFSALTMSVLLAIGLRRKSAFYICAVLLAIYVVLTGMQASAIRAGIMGFLLLWAMNNHRLGKMSNVLAFAAAAMTVANPKLLRYDIGFQLSFLALAGIVYFYPILKYYLDFLTAAAAKRMQSLRVHPRFKFYSEKFSKALSEVLLVTISAQILTLPIIACNFSAVSIIAPLSNILVLWTMGILTDLIIFGLFLGAFFPSVLFFIPAQILLSYIVFAARLCSGFKYAQVEILYLPQIYIAAYYCFCAAAAIIYNKLSFKFRF